MQRTLLEDLSDYCWTMFTLLFTLLFLVYNDADRIIKTIGKIYRSKISNKIRRASMILLVLIILGGTFSYNFRWFLTIGFWLPINTATLIVMDERPNWVRKWGNRVDTIPDKCVEWLHCQQIPLTGKQVNVSFLMKNRDTTWNIIRNDEYCPNCDPEDKARFL